MFKSFLFRTVLAACLLGFALPGSAQAQQRIYEGLEAQALQCAAYFSYTTYVLERRGLITLRNREEGALNATAILGQHVSGTYEQKRQAFQTVLSRMPDSDNVLIEEAMRYMGWCSERFLS